jgi:hypothetical protein
MWIDSPNRQITLYFVGKGILSGMMSIEKEVAGRQFATETTAPASKNRGGLTLVELPVFITIVQFL